VVFIHVSALSLCSDGAWDILSSLFNSRVQIYLCVSRLCSWTFSGTNGVDSSSGEQWLTIDLTYYKCSTGYANNGVCGRWGWAW